VPLFNKHPPDKYIKMKSPTQDTNKTYIAIVTALTFIVPTIGFVIERSMSGAQFTFELFSKWFVFSAVGLRLFLAGIRQTTKPEFTAKQIFHINSPDSFPVVIELGFANLCFGLVGLISFFKADWRIVSASASGLYYGLAGLLHLLKKPAGTNEKFALWTDLLIFALLLLYFVRNI
jgi:hypothetical protein